MKKITFLSFKSNHFILLILGLFIFGCGGSSDVETKASQEESKYSEVIMIAPEIAKKIGIETGVLQRTTMSQSFTAQGKVVVNPDYVARLNSPVSGNVRKIYVRIGDYVKQGQPLFELESMEIANIMVDYFNDRAEAIKAEYVRTKKVSREDIKIREGLITTKASFERIEAECYA